MLRDIFGAVFCLFDKKRCDDNCSVSVVIPALNGRKDLSILLPAIKKQSGIKEIEIIIVDSGSKDGTIQAAKKNGARVIRIPKKEFSHDHARNLGTSKARHEYLLFLTQDVLIPTKDWLLKMLKGMEKYHASAASCIETPRKDADMFSRISVWNHNRFMELGNKDRVLSLPGKKDYESLRMNSQLSDVACLIRKDIFDKFQFRTGFAEDVDLGLRLIKGGYRLALLSSAQVIHSHNRSPLQHLKRAYTDTIFMKRIFANFYTPDISPKDAINDIVLSYILVQDLTAYITNRKIVPCSPNKLLDETLKRLRYLRARPFLSAEQDGNILAIDELSAFLVQLKRIAGKASRSSRKRLTFSLIIYLNGITRKYIKKHVRHLNEGMLMDYINNIWRGYAFKAGQYLAYAYIAHKNNKIIKKIHKLIFDQRLKKADLKVL